jgi:hypothetical protein
VAAVAGEVVHRTGVVGDEELGRTVPDLQRERRRRLFAAQLAPTTATARGARASSLLEPRRRCGTTDAGPLPLAALVAATASAGAGLT